jgi:non-lysosomal glucosylceramidase
MKRRNFINLVGGTTIGIGAAPLLKSCSAEKTSDGNCNKDNEENIEEFSNDSRVRSGIALGGIGAGSLELRKDGKFYNWCIFNNIPRGIGPEMKINNSPETGFDVDRSDSYFYFMVRYQEKGKKPQLKLLNLTNGLDPASFYSYAPEYIFPWISPVKNIKYSGKFPFISMEFSDPEMPFIIKMTANTPFIAHDVKNSSVPGVYFDFEIISQSKTEMDVNIIATLRNLVGYHTNEKYFVTKLVSEKDYRYFDLSAVMDVKQSNYGQMGLASLSPDSNYYLGWAHWHPFYEVALRYKSLPNIDDTEGVNSVGKPLPEWLPETNGRNNVDLKTGKKIAHPGEKGEQKLNSSIARYFNLAPNTPLKHTFILSWFFPNQYKSAKMDIFHEPDLNALTNVGHYYEKFFSSSSSVADYLVKNRTELQDKTKKFKDDFYKTDVDRFVLNQVNSHLNTLITNSFLDKDGNYGIIDDGGLIGNIRCPFRGFNPDVNIYGSFLNASVFPELYKSALIGLKEGQTPDGMVGCNRVDWPSDYIQMVMRHFFWTNDMDFLKEMWPSVKKSFEYCLKTHDLNGDQMPEIFAHNNACSYDNLPMYGISSYILSQWLSALMAGIEGAKMMHDKDAETKYSAILEKGKKLFVDKLWNGKYYRLCNDEITNRGIDEGCLTDQLIGQWIVDQSGLGNIQEKEKIHLSIKEILKRNFEEDVALRNCSWTENGEISPIFPLVWNDQANTPWSGVEMEFASFLLYKGYYNEALKIIKAVDDRYLKAGLYWSHQEAGGHYVRPMAAWGILNGLLGLSINQGVYSFAPSIPKNKYTVFFAFPDGTAHYILDENKIGIKILSGSWKVKKLALKSINGKTQKVTADIDGNNIEAGLKTDDSGVSISFEPAMTLNINQVLTILFN